MFSRPDFEESKAQDAARMSVDYGLSAQALQLMVAADQYNYAYQQTWLGMPIIQLPEDILLTQQLFWADRPDVVIETGIAWGGSVVLHASLMELAAKGKVVAVDKVLPPHIRSELMKFPFSHRIHLIEGDSQSPATVDEVRANISESDRVAIFLDSDHSHQHVLAELRIYGGMATKGQHLTIYATAIANMPVATHRPRPWGPKSNPMTALDAYLEETDKFVIDESCNDKTLISFAPRGRLLCIK